MTGAAPRRTLCAQLATVATVVVMLALLPSLAGAARPVIERPKVKPASETIVLQGERKLLVKSLTIFHAHDVNVRATCRRCLRLAGPKARELQPARGITRFARLNWILVEGLHVRIFVTAPGAIGRFVVLGLSRDRLRVEASGCLDGAEPVDCSGEAPPPSSPQVTYPETVGGDTETWTDYKSAGGIGGPLIHAGQTVSVSCAVRGFAVANGNSWWYRIASMPWGDSYYASADAFYNNGQTSGSLLNTPYVDDRVPACAS